MVRLREVLSDAALSAHSVYVCGPAHGRLLGAADSDAFAARVRLALDPDLRFR